MTIFQKGNKKLEECSMQEETKQKGKAPMTSFRAGGVKATVWENEIKTKDGKTIDVYSVNIDRSYKDGDEWKTTNSFKLNDLPKVQLVASKAYEYLALKANDLED